MPPLMQSPMQIGVCGRWGPQPGKPAGTRRRISCAQAPCWTRTWPGRRRRSRASRRRSSAVWANWLTRLRPGRRRGQEPRAADPGWGPGLGPVRQAVEWAEDRPENRAESRAGNRPVVVTAGQGAPGPTRRAQPQPDRSGYGGGGRLQSKDSASCPEESSGDATVLRCSGQVV